MSNSEHAPWKDESWLRQKYCVEGMTIQEIADTHGTTFDTIRYYKNKFDITTEDKRLSSKAKELDAETLQTEYWQHDKSLIDLAGEYDVSETYILRQMKANDIPRRTPDQEKGTAWKDPEELERLYWEEGFTLEEIGDKLGCSAGTVSNWMNRHGIEREDTPEDMPPNYRTNRHGHEEVRTKIDGTQFTCMVHRLIAVADGELSTSAFLNGEKNVHHRNNIPWDNRSENLQVMSSSEHSKHHYKEIPKDAKGRLSRR